MDERIAAMPEEERTSAAMEEVFTQVMGKDGHGRVRLGGHGVCPSQVRGRGQCTNNYGIPDEQYNRLRREITADVMQQMIAMFGNSFPTGQV